jgi:hypothetical protein
VPTITANPAVTPQGRSEFIRAIRHAWAAGDLSDAAVREVTQLALGIIAEHAITPA